MLIANPKCSYLFSSFTFSGVCQANDLDVADVALTTGWHTHNSTMEHRAKKPPTAHSNQPHAVKGKCAVKNHWSYLLGSSKSSRKFSGRSVPCNIFSLCSLPPSSPGQEGDACLRSADCSEGLCCARHFWSRICKPVLTEGQVCTRHRRKGNHGLELFQRCDCGEGLACRPEKGERDHTVSRTAARNLHTCQRR